MGDPFHKYDIRGIYPEELTDELAYKIGKALVVQFAPKRLVVAHDHRTSSPRLFDHFAKGVAEMGCDVVSIGSSATPILYHVCVTEEFDLGVMITASHNPKEYNGFKVCTKEGQLVTFDKGLKEVRELVLKDQFEAADAAGMISEKDVLPEYVKYIRGKLATQKHPLKIVVDTGNGVAGPVVKKILEERENINVVEMYFELDGTYPNHEANPLKDENLQDLSERIRKENANLGFAFDGDADRCILMDENGEVVNTDMLLCLIADEEVKTHPGATFYYDLRFSKIVKEHLEQLGCRAIMSEVGNAVYKEKLFYEGGLIAAELSGHVMFSENHNLDDGFYLMAKILNYLNDLQQPVSQLIRPYKKYFQSPEINTKVPDPTTKLLEIKEKYREYDITEIDGVTVSAKSWWFNLRKSNTEPVVRMRVEADSKGLLDEKVRELKDFLAA